MIIIIIVITVVIIVVMATMKVIPFLSALSKKVVVISRHSFHLYNFLFSFSSNNFYWKCKMPAYFTVSRSLVISLHRVLVFPQFFLSLYANFALKFSEVQKHSFSQMSVVSENSSKFWTDLITDCDYIKKYHSHKKRWNALLPESAY